MAHDALGDRCKRFELAEADRRAMHGLPLLARLDGRAFHTFTRDLSRPFDPGMSRAMIDTTRHLVEETQALVGYTQSDEISLAWYEPSGSTAEYLFAGRFQKLVSVLAGMASARFTELLVDHLPDKHGQTPHFDCRVWQVPTLEDAVDVFLWREDDATRNSVAMAAQAHYDHGTLEGRSQADQHDMLHAKGVDWNDYPLFFKRGTYVQRHIIERPLSNDERLAIPEPHRPPPGALVQRTRVVELAWPPLRKVVNRVEALFGGAEPRTA